MDITNLIDEALEKISRASAPDILESVRIEYLGRNGQITKLLRSIGSLPSDQRSEAGQEANAAREKVEAALTEQFSRIAHQPKKSKIDTTLPGIRPLRGAFHPVRQVIQDARAVFRRLGFEFVEGREVETEFHNFTALNIPLDHPSRDAFDTFYTKGKNLLRSQTSTVQIRVMETRKPPLRIIAPGRVYRPDTVDASHSFMFHQIEGLLVDDRSTFSDLKGVINLFLRQFFGKNVKSRFRPHFFPFTEPSVEVDMSCILCGGKGCMTCKRTGWLEIMGAGMVDPAVFQSVGYPSGKYRGFAFGMGVERIAMLRHGIQDIRLFYENDLNFLRQFS
ncbi:MAG: phenylalanine--tRNA ligase subunit alpha [Candidatus Omnitrophica bacterium]|nr:phenylalanine--tRNA ligase subunit alpha [Candidatus Omnitrophota bacterium]